MRIIKSPLFEWDIFTDEFNKKAMNHFGSGWIWLVWNKENHLEIIDSVVAGDSGDVHVMWNAPTEASLSITDDGIILSMKNKKSAKRKWKKKKM